MLEKKKKNSYLNPDESKRQREWKRRREEYKRLISSHYAEKFLPCHSPMRLEGQAGDSPLHADGTSGLLGSSGSLSPFSSLSPTSSLTLPTVSLVSSSGTVGPLLQMPVPQHPMGFQHLSPSFASKFRLRSATDVNRQMHDQIHVDVLRTIPEGAEAIFESAVVQEVPLTLMLAVLLVLVLCGASADDGGEDDGARIVSILCREPTIKLLARIERIFGAVLCCVFVFRISAVH